MIHCTEILYDAEDQDDPNEEVVILRTAPHLVVFIEEDTPPPPIPISNPMLPGEDQSE